jgi:spermidine synthase
VLVEYDLDDKGTGHVFKRINEVVSETSEFQKIEISDLEILGRVLVLDNIIQLSELDCDRYHESFAHIPMSNLNKPTRVLILGGGDGILAKELLKYEGLIIDLVDIDPMVCELSKIHLSNLGSKSMENPRVKLHNEDALAFCKNARDSKIVYDCIFADITDPHPNSPSKSLLGKNTASLYKSLLKPGGFLVAQTDNIQIAKNHRQETIDNFSFDFQNFGTFGICAITLSSLFSFVWFSDINKIKLKDLKVNTNWLNKERYKFCLDFERVT